MRHARIWLALVWRFRKASLVLLKLLFPSWYGSGRKYQPERYYMRGPGPKWRAKHLSKSVG